MNSSLITQSFEHTTFPVTTKKSCRLMLKIFPWKCGNLLFYKMLWKSWHSREDTADSCRAPGYSRWKFCGTILASCLCRFLLQAIKYSQWPNRMQMLSTNLSSFERALVVLDVPAAPRFKNIHWCITALFDAFIIVQMLVCYLCCRQERAGCSMRPQFCLPLVRCSHFLTWKGQRADGALVLLSQNWKTELQKF